MRTYTLATLGVALSLGLGFPASAGMPDRAPAEKSLKGIVSRVDPGEKTLSVKTFWGTRRLEIAGDCGVSLQDRPEASLAELRPGQTVEVRYEESHGVRVARQIAQHNVVYTGYVDTLDAGNHSLTLRRRGLDKDFRIADDCTVMLHGGKTGTLADIKPGHRVAVTYEVPGGSSVARQIERTGKTFSGALTAIDLNYRTVKAKAFLGGKKFNLAEDCRIVVEGKPDAKMSDLRIGDELVFTYEDVDGVLVATRIGREPEPTGSGAETARSDSRGALPETPQRGSP